MATSSTSITPAEFKDALERYPKLLADYSKPPREGSLSLVELDKFRYEAAPSSFSKSTGRVMELSDVQKLLEWKMKHGTFRPTLGKLVASNSDEKVAAATEDAFAHYAAHPTDVKGVLEKLAKPLKGVGPATGSLLLAIHDPANVIYFSDELYRWLLHSGKKISPKYSASEFDDLYSEAKRFMARVKCTPIELEKVAFVVIKESEPTEPAAKYVPSGKPRGRPSKPDSEKKVRVPNGKPRGRPPKPDSEKKVREPNGKPRGRPARVVSEAVATSESKAAPKATKAKAETIEPKKRGRPALLKEEDEADADSKAPSTKKRGRPAKVKDEDEAEADSTTPSTKKRGRPSSAAAAAATTTTPVSKKRGHPSSASAKSSNKKIKV